MSTTFQEDVSSNVLQKMRDGGFNFARLHAIEFYAVFPDQERAVAAAGNFRGECLNTQISRREDGDWNLQVNRVMYATFDGIGEFEQVLENLVEPLGGVVDGWGVTQQVSGCPV